MIQRFQLLVSPTPVRTFALVDRAADEDAYEQALTAFRFAAEFDPGAYLGQVDLQSASTPGFRFTAEAQEVFDGWHVANEERIRSPQMDKWPAFTAHLSKYNKLVAGLALIDHMCLLALGERPTAARFSRSYGTVEGGSIQRAIKMAGFLEAHARKIYTAEIEPQIKPAYALAEKIRNGSIYDGMTVREIDRNGWAGLQSSKQAEKGLSLLARLGWLTVEIEKPATGRPSRVIRLNPQLNIDALMNE